MPGELGGEDDLSMNVGHYDRLYDTSGEWMNDVNRPHDNSEERQKERILKKMKSKLYQKKETV
jgi:hypothetical protein